MTKPLAELLFMKVLEEKVETGDIQVLTRSEDGDISCFTYTKQGQHKLEEDLANQAAANMLGWLKPENLN